MAHQKVSRAASAAATATLTFPVVSAAGTSGQNKQISLYTMLQGMGIAQYVESTVRTTATAAFLPSSSIFDIYVKALVGSSAADGGSDVEIGIGTDSTYFGTIRTSGAGMFRITVASAINFQNVSGAIVAAAPSATANSNFIVGVGYKRN